MAGEKPRGRPSRQQLLLEFDLQKEAQRHENSYQYFLCDAYPPSTKTISELDSINLAELQRDTHHRGRVLFVRIIDAAIRLAAVQNIIQDEKGDAERVAFYNSDPSAKADEVLPENALIAIKEPFYCAGANNIYSIRVDHPSDSVLLSPFNSRIPKGIVADPGELNHTALDWKTKGNAAYGAQHFHAAFRAYSNGLDVCSPGDVVRLDLLRNRAAVQIFLKRFGPALEDAKAAVAPPSKQENDTILALNIKAYERAGHAAYALGRFKEAKTCFQRIQELAPSNANASNNLKSIETRLHEMSTGEYDFRQMSRSSNKKHNRLDHANFTSNTIIRDAGKRGNGLFAIREIAAGQLIMVEKALSVAFDSDETSVSYAILNQDAQRALTGTQATLLFSLTQKLLHHPELAAEFFDLFDGGNRPKTSTQKRDDLVPVDTFCAQGIIEHNSFGCPTVRSSDLESQKQSASPAGYHSTGLWVRASYLNHACDGNAMRSFFGDMMILRAVRDIAKDEEILHPYLLPDAINATTQEKLQKTFGFECDCRICLAEAASPVRQRKSRKELIEKLQALLRTRVPSAQSLNRKASITQVENLSGRLRTTYEGQPFENTPRLGLIAPGLWLCEAYRYDSYHDKMIKTAISLLRDLGFSVSVTGKDVAIDREHGQLDGNAIEAAMYAAHGYNHQGNTSIGTQLEDFAKSLYLLISGEMRHFESKYKAS